MKVQKNRDTQKKSFDKKEYRLKKYSNKYKVGKWEEKRKQKALSKLRKELGANKSTASKNNDQSSSQGKKKGKAPTTKELFEKKQEAKRIREENILRKEMEREEALKKSKEKRLKRLKVFSGKTKKGQPLMKDRLELLLEKIQESKKPK